MPLKLEIKSAHETGMRGDYCFKCAVCSAVCCVTRFLGTYNPKESFVYDLFGSAEPEKKLSLWACSYCHRCHNTCPQDFSPAHMFSELKQVAYEAGAAPAAIMKEVETIVTTGFSYPISGITAKQREKLGLPPVAATNVLTKLVAAAGMNLPQKKEPGKP